MERDERRRAEAQTIPEEIIAGMAAVGAGSGAAVLGDAGSANNILGAPLGAAIFLNALDGADDEEPDNTDVPDA